MRRASAGRAHGWRRRLQSLTLPSGASARMRCRASGPAGSRRDGVRVCVGWVEASMPRVVWLVCDGRTGSLGLGRARPRKNPQRRPPSVCWNHDNPMAVISSRNHSWQNCGKTTRVAEQFLSAVGRNEIAAPSSALKRTVVRLRAVEAAGLSPTPSPPGTSPTNRPDVNKADSTGRRNTSMRRCWMGGELGG